MIFRAFTLTHKAMVTVTSTMVALCFQTNAEWSRPRALIVLLTKTFHWIHQKSYFNTKNRLISAGVGRMSGWQYASVPFLRASAWSHDTAKIQALLVKYWVGLRVSMIYRQVTLVIVFENVTNDNELHCLIDMAINKLQAKFSSVDFPEIWLCDRYGYCWWESCWQHKLIYHSGEWDEQT